MSELGYYNDSVGDKDTYLRPADRCGERCLNCDQTHGYHHGWACEDTGVRDFDELAWDKRYLTASMRIKGRGLPLKGKFAHKYDASGQLKLEHADLSDWRTWARVKPGECGCGIPRHQCKYHGNAQV